MNMGNGFGVYNLFGQTPVPNSCTNLGSNYDSSDEDSSLSSESEDETTKCEDTNSHESSQREHYCLDNARFRSDFEVVTLQDVKLVVEPMLTLSELISLVFLLYDTKLALQVIITLIAAGPEHFPREKISEWVRSKPKNWQSMLLEGLAVIQNYKILKKLGFYKDEIKVRFQPYTALYISSVKKMLYRTMECLTIREAKIVGDLFQFIEKYQLHYDTEYKYMEFHILFWVDLGYIIIDGSLLNLDKLILHLDILVSPLIKNMISELKSLVKAASLTYPIIDRDEVGLLLIINMDEFYEESNPTFKRLLSSDRLPFRKGSRVDVNNLIKTFRQLKFKVVNVDNVPHFDFEKIVCSYVEEHIMKKHSMFVLCVLSHGKEGIIYAANSIPVKIQDIQNCVSNLPQIVDKPKVIIIQACQGLKQLMVEPQKEMDGAASQGTDNDLHLDGSQLTLDGPEKYFSKYCDVLTCIATIEGYVAVRCPEKGTIYIEELCNCIREYHKDEHFVDIVTIVHRNLNRRPLHVKNQPKSNCKEHLNCLCIYMTPIEFSTLTKKLFLVPQGKL